MINLIRKSKTSRSKMKTLFVIPKLVIFVFLTLHTQNHPSFDISDLYSKLPKKSSADFFDNEFLNYCNSTKMTYAQEQMTLISVSQLKIQDRDKFLRILLLLTGNVELNPGPVQQPVSATQANIYENFKCRGMHFFHLNINSVLPKIDELRIIAKETKPSLIGLTETKIDNTVNDEEIQIPGYILERSDRNRKGGGVACYIKSDISYNVINTFSDEIENIFVDIMLPKTKPILVGVVYRPPDKSDFIQKFSEAISNSVNFDNQEVYILGDFNINVLDNSSISKLYTETCSLHGLKQIIESHTRITEHTSTLIDHILTNSVENISQSGVLEIGLSDHQAIFCTRKNTKTKVS